MVSRLDNSALAFIIGITSLFLVYKLLNIYLKRVFKIDVINPAYATLQAGILLSTALLISSIIGPGLNAIRFLNQDVITAQTIAGSMGYVIMFWWSEWCFHLWSLPEEF